VNPIWQSSAKCGRINGLLKKPRPRFLTNGWQTVEKLRFSTACARYKDVPPFLMAASHKKMGVIRKPRFRMTMLKKPWMAFSTLY